MSASSADRIQRQIELRAPVARVWRALTNHREFGQWFRVNLEGRSRRPNNPRSNRVSGLRTPHMEVAVHKMEPEPPFSFHWHPYAVDPKSGLLPRAPDAGGIHTRADRRRNAIHGDRIRFRLHPRRRRDEKLFARTRRLGRTNEEYRRASRRRGDSSEKYGSGRWLGSVILSEVEGPQWLVQARRRSQAPRQKLRPAAHGEWSARTGERGPCMFDLPAGFALREQEKLTGAAGGTAIPPTAAPPRS